MPRSSSSTEQPLLQIGRVSKAHGLRGDVVVVPITNVGERRFTEGASFDTEPSGPRLTIAESRPDKGAWLVHFDGVDGREAAEALRGTILCAPPLDDPDEWWVHELVGATVMLVDGSEVGSVADVIDNPAADLLRLDSGVLVPVVFALSFDRDSRTVVIDPPEGLLDL